MSKKVINVIPRVEEVLILSALGAAIGLALASPLVAGASSGYLPSNVHGLGDVFRAGAACASMALGAGAGAWLALRQERDTHVDGARYIAQHKKARAELQALELELCKENVLPQSPPGIVIGGVEISNKRATTHFQAIGQTGQGKSTIYNSIGDQVLEREGRLILFDIKNDLVKRYFDPKTCVLVGPWDARAAVWDAPADFDDPTAVTEFANAIMEVEAAKRGKSDPHWVEGAAAVLAGVMRSYMRGRQQWTWAGLVNDLHAGLLPLVQQAALGSTEVRLRFPHAFLPANDDGPYLDKEEASMARAVTDGISGWMEEMAVVDATDKYRPRFSFSRWLTGAAHREVRVVIFNYSKKYATPARRLFGAMLGVVATTMSGGAVRDIDADAPGLWCVFDEVVQMGPGALKEINSLMALGRSRGARVLLAFQAASQIEEALGQEAGRALLDQAVTQIYLHPSPRAVKEICDAAGERHVDRIESTGSNGATQGKTKHQVKEPVLVSGDLESLGEVDGGVELILHVKDVLGRLVQPFALTHDHEAEAFVESETWKWGALKALEEADLQGGGGSATPAVSQESVVDLTFDWKEEE